MPLGNASFLNNQGIVGDKTHAFNRKLDPFITCMWYDCLHGSWASGGSFPSYINTDLDFGLCSLLLQNSSTIIIFNSIPIDNVQKIELKFICADTHTHGHG